MLVSFLEQLSRKPFFISFSTIFWVDLLQGLCSMFLKSRSWNMGFAIQTHHVQFHGYPFVSSYPFHQELRKICNILKVSKAQAFNPNHSPWWWKSVSSPTKQALLEETNSWVSDGGSGVTGGRVEGGGGPDSRGTVQVPRETRKVLFILGD